MRRALVTLAAALLLAAAPGTASAQVIFEPSDADDLAQKLEDAYQEQGVCYGWDVDVDNVGSQQESVGSNFGADTDVDDGTGDCDATVEFQASIRWTSESSEIEDSASYQVVSSGSGPTTSDLDSLEIISAEGMAGDNVGLEVYKAVSALPLLAAEAGLADPIEASPAPPSEARADNAEPTDSPTSDFLRQSGGAFLFGAVLLVAGVVFAIWAFRTRGQGSRPVRTAPPPEYVPPEWYDPNTARGDVRPRPPDQPEPGTPNQNKTRPEE
ncbi:hypothetical protein [Actinophytocola gossypii]|uniref:Uncharacterized protein n=1 Tax=Actinophytocola gossypii TaxID=2812003 RepID=A0ABT2JAS1_9PSEU|nr:hypothetical protein [Actinophytocola gossypii]MCT2584963.1 hypothetical protein [Actinophytocola gossypii]